MSSFRFNPLPPEFLKFFFFVDIALDFYRSQTLGLKANKNFFEILFCNGVEILT